MTTLDLFRLDNKVAIVTGGSKGLGASMAQALAEAGAHVVVCSRDGAAVQAVAQELTDGHRQPCRGYACDVTDPAQVEALVAQVLAEFGQIDILVNNAGINIRGPIEELSLEQFQQVHGHQPHRPLADVPRRSPPHEGAPLRAGDQRRLDPVRWSRSPTARPMPAAKARSCSSRAPWPWSGRRTASPSTPSCPAPLPPR